MKNIQTELIQEYAKHPLVHDTNRHLADKFMECDKNNTFIGLKEIQLKIKDFVRNQKVYSVNFDQNVTNVRDDVVEDK